MDIFSTDFFKDEVRSGFYIPTVIKQSWALSLSVLAEVDRICRKHNISYYAEWGTLLGAVRHGGFIPWDDDLDIGMRREDYIKFRQVADEELPKEFAIHDYERKDNHWLFLSRVVAKNQICFDEEHLEKYHNFPYIVGLDIFVMDYLYRDEASEKERCDEILHIIALADAISGGKTPVTSLMPQLREFEKRYGVSIDTKQSEVQIAVELYRLAEKQMARVPAEEADCMGQIFPWVIKGNKGLPKELYAQTVRIPFECMEIPVPVDYNTVLSSRYSDYFTVRKVWGGDAGHTYPYFETQKRNLMEVLDFELPEFKYNRELDIRNSSHALEEVQNVTSESLRGTAKECMVEFAGMLEDISSFLESTCYEEALAILPECQQLAVDLGTLVERVKGENNACTIKVVASLQGFCDAVYSLYQELVGGRSDSVFNQYFEDIRSAYDTVNVTIDAEIINKNTVVFVTIGAVEWNAFLPIYEEKLAANSDVYVVPLPILTKNPYGEVKCSQEELLEAVHLERYPDYLQLSDWSTFNFEFLRPDEIYIQNPYDGENPYLTVPGKYYSLNLKAYTDKLIYVPAFIVEEFGPKDTTTLYNMKHYVTAPGVMYADKIVVQSDNMRGLYIDKLTEFAGEDTRNTWEDKVVVNRWIAAGEKSIADIIAAKKAAGNFKACMLFCIGINELGAEKDNFIENIKRKFDMLKAGCRDILVDVCLYPQNINEWKRIDSKLSEALLSELEVYEAEGVIRKVSGSVSPYEIAKYDACYGSPSPFVHWFNCEGKPIMIMSLSV